MILLPLAMTWFGSLLYAADQGIPRIALQDPVDPTTLARMITTIGRPPLEIAVRVPIELERSTKAANLSAGANLSADDAACRR